MPTPDSRRHMQTLQWVKTWAIPAASALVVSTGAYWRFEFRVSQMEKEIHELREIVERRSAFGPDGFLDPAIRSGLNLTIRAETRDCVTRDELRRALERR